MDIDNLYNITNKKRLKDKKMKTYKTYQARNAVKAAQVTNHIKAQKKVGVSHEKAKAEAYRLYQIKKARPILLKYFNGLWSVWFKSALHPFPSIPEAGKEKAGY